MPLFIRIFRLHEIVQSKILTAFQLTYVLQNPTVFLSERFCHIKTRYCRDFFFLDF